MSEETKGGHDLKNSSTKITSDKTIKVEVTNATVDKGAKKIIPWMYPSSRTTSSE